MLYQFCWQLYSPGLKANATFHLPLMTPGLCRLMDALLQRVGKHCSVIFQQMTAAKTWLMHSCNQKYVQNWSCRTTRIMREKENAVGTKDAEFEISFFSMCKAIVCAFSCAFIMSNLTPEKIEMWMKTEVYFSCPAWKMWFLTSQKWIVSCVFGDCLAAVFCTLWRVFLSCFDILSEMPCFSPLEGVIMDIYLEKRGVDRLSSGLYVPDNYFTSFWNHVSLMWSYRMSWDDIKLLPVNGVQIMSGGKGRCQWQYQTPQKRGSSQMQEDW